jgi:uncharacterized membrane protein
MAPGVMSAAETVDAIARAKVAIKSRLVVLENLSVIMFLSSLAGSLTYNRV